LMLCTKRFINNNDIECIEYLLNAGANSNIQNTDGVTPLMFACDNKKERIVNLLLNKGANCLINDKNGNTALHIACMAHDSITAGIIFLESNNDIERIKKDCTQLLLSNNKDLIDVQNDEGKTPLHVAVEQGQ